ncbi:MAG: methylenetetrahydrofolate reductase [Bacteroidia bacterium]|nr:methylenetetrahydrofolate reductase [Bacteroidia bacterium]MDW8347941.1 methylenetetrahydrofolate reductase [Bacteroidia bacterium]
MKVIEHLESAKNPLISIEIIPPKRGGNVQQIFDIVQAIIPFNPAFIDITSHAAEAIYEEMPDGRIIKRVKRKRPGTIGLCAAIKNKFNIDPVPHILCQGFTREETEDALIELNYLGVENVLCVRGDSLNYTKIISDHRTVNTSAVELVQQVHNLSKGIYQDELIDAAPLDFCIGVGGYPEKHFEAPSLTFDIQNTKRKIDAGAHYIVTQMFFDNTYFFNYVEKCRKAGITVPIIPGLKILTNVKQLHSVPRSFHVNIPDEFVDAMLHASDTEQQEIGIQWALKQSIDLLEAGVPCLHYYIMQNTEPIVKLLKMLKKKM